MYLILQFQCSYIYLSQETLIAQNENGYIRTRISIPVYNVLSRKTVRQENGKCYEIAATKHFVYYSVRNNVFRS